ncbi:hypothetical protein [Sphingobacterium bovisgrunnientis]|uniref:hypothetical protein n=1 Tax=Sphingobacterium bovisgrunnientis TaxID=1874697 RepID=UPI0013587613|nr:hypothetical protein [Sphingobacterium bovisgrunnientis]
MNKLTLHDIFESLTFNFRIPMRASYILTDCSDEERAKYLAQFLKEQPQIIHAPAFASPKELFDFIKANQQASLYFEDEVLSKRVEYIHVLEGAICANDLGKPWQVKYEIDSFEFKGKVLLACRIKKEELKKREQLKYILRDSVVI